MNRTEFYTRADPGFFVGGLEAINAYNNYYMHRKKQYEFKIDKQYDKYVMDLNNLGYSKIENFFNLNKLDKFKQEVFQIFKNSSRETTSQITRLVHNGDHEQIIEPYLNTEHALQLATDKRIVNIASSFFNCLPALGGCNLRRSFVTDKPPSGVNMFHRDFNSPVKFIKFFIYLNDVDIDNGPFTYVEGSNKVMPANPHWSQYHRWSDDKIEKFYGKNNIKYLTANYGDLLIATTNGFHKGLKIKKGERTMFTINYLIHPPVPGGPSANFKNARNAFEISHEKVNQLPEWKKPLTDFLIKV